MTNGQSLQATCMRIGEALTHMKTALERLNQLNALAWQDGPSIDSSASQGSQGSEVAPGKAPDAGKCAHLL